MKLVGHLIQLEYTNDEKWAKLLGKWPKYDIFWNSNWV